MAEDYLKKLLDQDLQSKLDSIKRAAEKIWERPKIVHFTKHGIDEHSKNIITILDLILGDMSTMKNKLSEHEIFILLAASYLHDIGMQSAYHAGLPDKPDYGLEDKKIIRDKHNETSAKIIRESVDSRAERRVKCGLEDCINPNYVNFIALLSESHRMNKPEISSDKLKDDYLMIGAKIRVRLLVSLLRLADELDRDYTRVNLDELKSWNIPTDSKMYWWMHHYTKAVSIENGRIKILFRVPIQYENSQSNLDEIIFRTVIDGVNKQFSEVRDILWERGIKLYFEPGDPKADNNNYIGDPTLLLIPDDVIDYTIGELTQKSANGLTTRTGPTYWLDGIPQSDDKELRERTFRFLTLMEEERYDDAIAEMEYTLKVCILSPTEKMSILLNLGNAYYSLSQIGSALKNYNAILELTQKVSEKEAIEGKSSALGNIGLIYRAKGDLDKALKYHRDALKIHREIGYKQGEASDLGNIGLIYSNKDDLDNALKYLRDALKIHREIGYKQGEASALGNIGLIYSDKGDLDKALKYHRDALKIHREIGYKQGEASDLGNIGLIYSYKGDLDKALKYHRDALKIHREIGYKQGEANQLGNIGLIYSDKGDLDKALKYHRDALKIDKEIGYKRGEASDLGNIGLIYSDKGDLDKALKYLRDALKIDKEIGYKQGEASDLGNIGLILKAKGDLDKALKYLRDAFDILIKFNLVYGRDIIQNAINSITHNTPEED
ncbi:MAG: hypothetical protein AEth_00415 [Candidatus Argoarchaeum ethanivorans]|uniref:HD-CE domain-containing protein n=1 Tax=Candidatus Argoarchaeum ethanivorans TaxID=2608793 RepID=A0A8B3S5W1_9EURY|nr:MAG: hypothetical protein AEth_00415 [Candidatus Argoarchaeum ethanivorans]